jgi:signal transduction histidine kinase
MSTVTPDLASLANVSAGLALHEHLCLIYDTQEEKFAAALPYLRAGLEQGERCLYIADEDSAVAVLDALRKRGIDVDAHVRRHTLIMADKNYTYLAHGHFDPDLWIQFLSEAIARKGKFAGVKRILGEMTWALSEETAVQSLLEYEAKLNRFVHDHDIRVVCQYNRNRCSPELMLGVIRTHPVVAYGGIFGENPYYVPADEFLAPNQAAREVDRLLSNILKWQKSMDQMRALTARLLTVQEAERQYLARELHDEIGQVLTGLRLLLRPGGNPASVALTSRLEQARTIIEELLARVQGLSFDLRPADLDHLGLLPALLALFERYTAQTGILVNFMRDGMDRRFSPEVETNAYRIVQEALTNVARHAGVTSVTVRFGAYEDRLTLQIEDRGRGFDPEAVRKAPASIGLMGIEERAMVLGGRLTVESIPGHGTTITAELPIKETAAA